MTVWVQRRTIHRTFGIGLIDLDKPNAVVSGAATDTPVEVVDATDYDQVVRERDGLLEHIHGNEHTEQLGKCSRCRALLGEVKVS